MTQEERMPHLPIPTDAPHDWGTPGHRFLFGETGLRHPVVGCTRRSILVAYGPRRLRLRRRHLERQGVAVAAGIPFYISSYYLPERAACKEQTMGQSVFILDLPDLQTAAVILPDDKERERLEKQLRKAHTGYRACLRRRGEIEAAIVSVSLELARKSEPELISRISALMAEQAVYPTIFADTAEAYARTLAAWAAATWQAFDTVHREAEAVMDESLPAFDRLVRRQHGIRRSDDPQHAKIQAELADIAVHNRPIAERRDLAHQGRSAVAAVLDMTLGIQSRRGQVAERDIEAFVSRHASRKVAAA